VYKEKGSKFDRIVPEKSTGDCGMMPIFDLKSYKLHVCSLERVNRQKAMLETVNQKRTPNNRV
jgi:hypothetical protein